MSRNPVITFIGAGSTVFARNLLTDILSFPELSNAEIRLYDINEERLNTSEVVARRLAQTLGIQPTIVSTLDRERALDGADYAINMIQVGGYQPATVTDFEIPKKYGLRQTIADTLGIGGIMRALRTIPVFLDMARDMERLCPEVTHLNYVNPMVMNCLALNRATRIKTIGLCHSVQHTAQELANDLGIPVQEINYIAAGINHMAFYLKFERDGEDLYPQLQEIARTGKMPDWNRVRYEMLTRLGFFVTESSEHFSEYVPYFIKEKHPELIERFNIPLDEYPRRCVNQIAGWEDLRKQLEDPTHPMEVHRSVEYGSLIIHSLETGIPRVVYGNVQNDHLIENLPLDSCVEVPVLVDRNGLQPTRIGKLPPQLAALMQTNINVQSLTVEAALTGKKEHIYHAAMLDPHTSTELTLDEIWSLVDDLLEAHRGWVPDVFLKEPVLS
ncbi:alpha-glucosidase/alpha-galactosidase [Deinococcus roseus]|uniref:Alpha-glucosidase/alpha-galactosidase n=1 Tax=Deinococcus roseus TaxID=392414 RepID=A0ABQ2D3E9_9DEIO|nr:alpha-glucosidase/alpha-galactosidase [Deinococcus roseus]GGJ40867.1 alpha-glucosidase/alpha-galactosidase [Deinococcus roseus]